MGLATMVIDYEVIMATWNGRKYLIEQLNSIASQSVPPKRIIVSDDGSSDNTIELLNQWQTSNNLPLIIYTNTNENLGSCKNFEKLLFLSSASYVMLSDQDDLWDPCKAENYITAMLRLEKKYSQNVPLLVHSDLRVVNDDASLISNSFFSYERLNSNRNDWISIGLQNIVTGCACLVNRACVEKSLPFADETILHDWWLALVAARFGQICFLPKSYISYRQHQNNLVGATGFKRRLISRFFDVFSDSFIEHSVGLSLRQLYSFQQMYLLEDLSLSAKFKALFSKRMTTRLRSAYSLRMSKHGSLRTIVFYILLMQWHPTKFSKNT